MKLDLNLGYTKLDLIYMCVRAHLHACMHVWADVGQIGEFVLLRLWDLGLGEIVDVEFRNC